MRKTALLLALLFLPSLAFGQAGTFAPPMGRVKFGASAGTSLSTATCITSTGTTTPMSACAMLSAVALNATASSRTFTVKTYGFSTSRFQVNYTFGAASAVTCTCKGSMDGGATYASILSSSVSAGLATDTVLVDSYSTGSASANIIFTYDTRNYDALQCVLAGTGANGSDLVTVYGTAAVGQ